MTKKPRKRTARKLSKPPVMTPEGNHYPAGRISSPEAKQAQSQLNREMQDNLERIREQAEYDAEKLKPKFIEQEWWIPGLLFIGMLLGTIIGAGVMHNIDQQCPLPTAPTHKVVCSDFPGWHWSRAEQKCIGEDDKNDKN